MMLELPTELLLCILCYLDLRSVLTLLSGRPSLVCPDRDSDLWHGLADHPWHILSGPFADLARLVSVRRYLRSLPSSFHPRCISARLSSEK
ncbi:hypothetical protein BCR43DRAFT_481873 [Syncephalastrum racemosum]|uniref:F-box domain-containing protein n=1 Tax=Syncephalastrum racemosum TaxID=13706 RepID=A0A1X2HT27_SYNRA|nr:hypothetical protein BCR43DRAFT_481873 [Syncephalastrum racemosum]